MIRGCEIGGGYIVLYNRMAYSLGRVCCFGNSWDYSCGSAKLAVSLTRASGVEENCVDGGKSACESEQRFKPTSKSNRSKISMDKGIIQRVPLCKLNIH
jgi:hypothetical protein